MNTKDITTYARFLRNAAPQAYDNFLAAVTRYKDQSIQDMIDTTENVLLAQGRAQQCVKILQALEEVN